MKRECPLCHIRIKPRFLNRHLKEKHDVEPFTTKREFKCFEDCVYCCSDPVMPISINVTDLRRISKFLNISISELYENYCTINQLTDPQNGTVHIPTISFSIPCKFLKNKKCSIYEVRPIACKIFPAFLDEPLSKKGYGYRCIDEGCLIFDSDELKKLEETKEEAEMEGTATAEYFKFYNYSIQLTEKESGDISAQISKKMGIDIKVKIINQQVCILGPGDISRKRLAEANSLYNEFVVQKIRGRVGTSFLDKCKELEEQP